MGSQGVPAVVGRRWWDKVMIGEKRGCEKKIYGIHWRWGQNGSGGCNRCSAPELEIRLGIGFGGAEGEAKVWC